MPKDSSSAENPLTIVLADVNRSQAGCDPSHSFITIAEGNYVIVRLRGTNTIVGGEQEGVGSNDGMAGIHVSQGATLKVTSDEGDGAQFSEDGGEKGLVKITGGTIDAKGGGNGEGVGGGNGSDHINVQIDENAGAGLSMVAKGGENGAGIGGANDPGVGMGGDAKTIEVYGTGTVKAYGGGGAAAICGGYDNEVSDHITIEGDYAGDKGRGLSIVVDSGGGTAAGIGSGSEDCGPISIKNATVDAWGDSAAADIGTGGNWGNGGVIESITIENCRITTHGGNKTGAGIGAGHGCECRKIAIKDSECYGNSIGEGMGVYFKVWFNYGNMDSITIENSDITATWDRASKSDSAKGSAAAGIGSCTLGSIGSISISDSTVTAKGINGGAGIGSGGWGADDYLGFECVGGSVGGITIKNSSVNATGGEPGVQSNAGSPGPDLTHRPVVGGGAGIGGGGNTKCGTIAITGSEVTAKAGKYAASIGRGGSESVDAVDISGSTVTTTGGMYGAGIGSGGSTSAVTATVFHADADTIKISGSTVTATGGKYAAGIGASRGSPSQSPTPRWAGSSRRARAGTAP